MQTVTQTIPTVKLYLFILLPPKHPPTHTHTPYILLPHQNNQTPHKDTCSEIHSQTPVTKQTHTCQAKYMRFSARSDSGILTGRLRVKNVKLVDKLRRLTYVTVNADKRKVPGCHVQFVRDQHVTSHRHPRHREYDYCKIVTLSSKITLSSSLSSSWSIIIFITTTIIFIFIKHEAIHVHVTLIYVNIGVCR